MRTDRQSEEKGATNLIGVLRDYANVPKICKVKVKILPIQATKARRAGRGIALPNLRPRH